MGASEDKIDYAGLIKNIPVGVCKFFCGDGYRLIYANPFFYHLFGYTPEQFAIETGDRISRTFLVEERAALTENLDRQIWSGGSGFHMEHRIRQRDGTVIWVLVTGSFTTHDGARAAYCMVMDITDRKQMEEQLRIDEERFRLALAQTDNTIFDYNIATKVMIHADKSAEKYGLSHITYNVPDYLVEEKIVHPDTVDVYLEMYRRIRAGESSASCVVQARGADGRYAWQKIVMTNIFNQDGQAVRAVGLLEDIDEQTRREALLRERSQRDALTGLYHKGATESLVKERLKNERPSGALLIIDVDAFKSVNDHYGHMFGDLVLSEGTHRIASLFREGDVIGRIGGDEFLVFVDGKAPEELAWKKAEEICGAFQKGFQAQAMSATVTCTVGVALCPVDGTTFEVLYQKADMALYEAKRRGKGRWCRYAPGMERALGAPENDTSSGGNAVG